MDRTLQTQQIIWNDTRRTLTTVKKYSHALLIGVNFVIKVGASIFSTPLSSLLPFLTIPPLSSLRIRPRYNQLGGMGSFKSFHLWSKWHMLLQGRRALYQLCLSIAVATYCVIQLHDVINRLFHLICFWTV